MKAMVKLGKEYGVELPISEVVYEVLYNDAPPSEALQGLFNRRVKGEFYR